MKKHYYILLFLAFSFTSAQAQVTGIYTDYQGFWASFENAVNPTKPINSHNLLGFEYNGTTYSTGVNDAILSNNGLSFTAENYRALPLAELNNISSSNSYIGLGQIYDEIDNGIDNSSQNPFAAITNGAEAAYFLTNGPRGLDLGTGIANIAAGTNSRFELSTNGITQSKINDNIPDIVIANIATPSANNADLIKFIDAAGNTVGNSLSVVMNNNPVVATWTADFYNFDSSQPTTGLHNTSRNIRFFAAKLTDLGIDGTNYQNAVALVYTSGGSSDPAFLAYNEEAIGVASKIDILSSSTTAECDGSLSSNIEVAVRDFNNDPVLQNGFSITASIYTGAGALLGTTTKSTNANGEATFNDLSFEVGDQHKIIFESTSLKPAITDAITSNNCPPITWTGAVNQNWDNPGNWNPQTVPNANYGVTIPNNVSNYPVLTSNTGARNLFLQDNSTLDLNGYLFNISNRINTSGNGTSKIFGAAPGSTLHYTGNTPQIIQNGLINDGKIANLSLENPGGLQTVQALKISQVLRIIEGEFKTNNQVTLTCDFATNTAGQIAKITGSINGKITTEQCFPARRAFRMVASPVTTDNSINANWQEGVHNTGLQPSDNMNPNNGYGTHITGSTSGSNGLDATPSGNPSLFSFENNNQDWTTVSNTASPNLEAAKPYLLMVRGSRLINVTSNSATPTNTKIRATGTILSGDQTFSTNFSATQGDFNAFGNPYPAAVDMRKVLNDPNTRNTGRYFYIYDPTLGGTPTVGQPGGRGAYVTIDVDDLSTEILPNATVGTSEANRFLQPMQAAFFVTANENLQPVLKFTEDYKNTNEAGLAVFRSENAPATIAPNKSIQFYLFTEDAYTNNSSYSDRLKINFSSNYDNAITAKDAPKLFNLDENLSREENGTLISLEKRALPQDEEVLALDINQYRTENYIFQISVSNLEKDVYLEDAYLETSTLLENGDNTIYFEADASAELSMAADRFSLRFENNALNNESFEKAITGYYPNPIKNNQLFINLGNSAKTDYQIEVYNVVGQKVFTNRLTAENGKLQVEGLDFPSGLYYMVLRNAATNTKETIKIIKS